MLDTTVWSVGKALCALWWVRRCCTRSLCDTRRRERTGLRLDWTRRGRARTCLPMRGNERKALKIERKVTNTIRREKFTSIDARTKPISLSEGLAACRPQKYLLWLYPRPEWWHVGQRLETGMWVLLHEEASDHARHRHAQHVQRVQGNAHTHTSFDSDCEKWVVLRFSL